MCIRDRTTTLAPDKTMYLDAINTGINNMAEGIANELQDFAEQLDIAEITNSLPSDHFQTQDEKTILNITWMFFFFFSSLMSMSFWFVFLSNKESSHIKGLTYNMDDAVFNDTIEKLNQEELGSSTSPSNLSLDISKEEKHQNDTITTSQNLVILEEQNSPDNLV